jgi:hypothetical protein
MCSRAVRRRSWARARTSPSARCGRSPRPEPGPSPVSVPRPPRARPAATAMPVPALDPDAVWSSPHGLCGIGKPLVGSGRPQANSLVVVLPTKTAPTFRSRATTGASMPLPQSGASTRLLAVVGASLVAMMSLTASGMPWRGPESTPLASAWSACSAAARAVSGGVTSRCSVGCRGFRCHGRVLRA